MTSIVIEVPVETGADYQFHIREMAADSLVDFTGSSFALVGREHPNSPTELFRYSEVDTQVIEVGVFSISDSKGVVRDHNLKITIPHTDTEPLKTQALSQIHIGLLWIDSGGLRKQIIADAKLRVCDSVA